MPDYLEMKDGGGVLRKVGAIEATIGGVANVFTQKVAPHRESRQDTFTGVASGTTIDTSAIPCNRFAIQVKGTGAAPTAWEVVIEGSLNGSQFTIIATHKNTETTDGAVRWQSAATPVKHFRSRCVGLTLGSATNIAVDILGEAGV